MVFVFVCAVFAPPPSLPVVRDPTSLLKLKRSSEGGFPDAVVTKAAAALQKAITFRDVRARVADVTPLAVVSLVELLRQEAYENTGNGARDREKCQKEKMFHEKIEAAELPALGQMVIGVVTLKERLQRG